MKKYSSGSFVDAAVRVYGSEADTISSFPASIIGNGGNITPWTIYGNTSAGQSVGEKTANLLNFDTDTPIGTANYSITPIIDTATFIISKVVTGSAASLAIPLNITLPAGKYTISVIGLTVIGSLGNYDRMYLKDSNDSIIINYIQEGDPKTFTLSGENTLSSLNVPCAAESTYDGDIIKVMLNTGETALSYEPYGYKLPVVIGSTTTNIYMADVLRMSSGADPVYDVMSSTGIITRNVDTDGSPLVTPTTENFTAPTLATVAGSQSFNIDTTVKPSSVSLTYTGWHTHSDKQYSGGQWGQVTSNAKVLRRKKSAKSKT